jgi:hypothetical protein
VGSAFEITLASPVSASDSATVNITCGASLFPYMATFSQSSTTVIVINVINTNNGNVAIGTDVFFSFEVMDTP